MMTLEPTRAETAEPTLAVPRPTARPPRRRSRRWLWVRPRTAAAIVTTTCVASLTAGLLWPTDHTEPVTDPSSAETTVPTAAAQERSATRPVTTSVEPEPRTQPEPSRQSSASNDAPRPSGSNTEPQPTGPAAQTPAAPPTSQAPVTEPAPPETTSTTVPRTTTTRSGIPTTTEPTLPV